MPHKDPFHCYKTVMYFFNLIEGITSDAFCTIYLELWGPQRNSSNTPARCPQSPPLLCCGSCTDWGPPWCVCYSWSSAVSGTCRHHLTTSRHLTVNTNIFLNYGFLKSYSMINYTSNFNYFLLLLKNSNLFYTFLNLRLVCPQGVFSNLYGSIFFINLMTLDNLTAMTWKLWNNSYWCGSLSVHWFWWT